MDRRNLIRLVGFGSVVGIIAPDVVLASSQSMAGGLYYTKDAPGRWSKKAVGHLPQVAVSKNDAGTAIQVITPHEVKGYEHYIVKHMLLDQEFNFIAEKMFDPATEKSALSNFELDKSYAGSINVLSVCNKHDTWLNVVEV